MKCIYFRTLTFYSILSLYVWGPKREQADSWAKAPRELLTLWVEKKCVSFLSPCGLKAKLCCSAGCRRCSESVGSHREPVTAQIDCDHPPPPSLCAHCQILARCASRAHSSFLSKSKREQTCSLLLFFPLFPLYFFFPSSALTVPCYAPNTTCSGSLRIQTYWARGKRTTGWKKCLCWHFLQQIINNPRVAK